MDVTRPTTMVDIAITEVVVDGLGPVDQSRLRRALERDLARLVETRGLPASWAAPGARSDVAATVGWEGLGDTDGLSAAVAEQIYEGLAT